MATIAEIRQQYPQYTDMSDADLAGALHQKFYADMPREDFDKRLGLAPVKEDDVYTATAKKELAADREKGVPRGVGYARRAIQGATFNAADEVIAAGLTPFEMIKRGTLDPREGYKYAKAREDLELDEARKSQGLAGTATEVLGGVGTGVGLARAGLTATRALAPNAGLTARSTASAVDAGIYGAVAGGMEGNTLAERGKNAAIGGAGGLAIGGVMPGAMALGGAALSPIVSNIRARVNPEGYARSQVARALQESSRTPQQIADDVAMAAQEGQPMYTMADALGNPGQRMLSSVARAPGQGRTEVTEFLDARQSGQGRRMAAFLAEGFDSPQTAAQTRTAMTGARDTAADAAYGAARQNANPVDVSSVIARIDDTLQPGVNQIARPQSGIANDSIETALESIRSRLTDGRSVATDFTAIQRVRGDLSDAIQAAQQQGANNKARLLGQVLRELDTSMEAASGGFRQANRNFAQSSRNIEAIDDGANAAMRGRTEDIVPQFRGLNPQGQAGYRAGYVDPLIQQAQGAAYGANKARPLINDAFQAEAAAIAPLRTGQQMQRRIGRENTMFETRGQATGGSRTADNLADQGAMGVDPTMIAQLLSGNVGGAARSLLSAGSNMLTGNTPAVRAEIGRLLTMRGGNVTQQQMQDILQEAIQRVQLMQSMSSQIGRGAYGGAAVAPAAIGSN